ncbi:ephexin-1 isoform X2 [Denticeps clupeoides]|uniref:ephexin-1 isoform X2 n=1 Tax=Denticeps clupeoides TaxID=299321 RepID=UPI0010A577FA|nr:ephexin-1-like isoform X2 [Denticeps clupeoides]
MGTEKHHVIKPALPPKPQIPPIPFSRGERKRRTTNVNLRNEKDEERQQDLNRQLVKHMSLPPSAIRRRRVNPVILNPVNPQTSSLREKPIPKPRTHKIPPALNSSTQPRGAAVQSSTNTLSDGTVVPDITTTCHCCICPPVHPQKLPLSTESGVVLPSTGDAEDTLRTSDTECMEISSNSEDCSSSVSGENGPDKKAQPKRKTVPTPCIRHKSLPLIKVDGNQKRGKICESELSSNMPLDLLAELQLKLAREGQGRKDIVAEKPTAKKPPAQEAWRKLSVMAELILHMRPTNQEAASKNEPHAQTPLVQTNQDGEDKKVSPTIPNAKKPDPAEEDSPTNKKRCQTLSGLWQERSIVRKNGIVKQLTKQQIQLYESMYEVVTTECTFLRSLDVVVDHFLQSPDLSQALSATDCKFLFSDIVKIRTISQDFLQAMKKELDINVCCDICKVIQHYASGPFSAFVDYVRNIPSQDEFLQNLGKKSPHILNIVHKLQEDPCCQRLPLKSFLSLPFQRITRIKILVENILKNTEPGSEVQKSAEAALKEVSKVVEACNRDLGTIKQMEKMVHTGNKIEFEYKRLPLVSSSRCLLKEGDLSQLSAKGNFFGQRRVTSIYLFLFNDLLLVATRKGQERFVVQDHAHRSLIEVSSADNEEDLTGRGLERTFKLVLLKNHLGRTTQLLLQASSVEEKDSWMEVLSKQKSGEENVYEEWDCPQFQCTKDYQAQHPDGLSLQEGDIINILQKNSAGMLRGWRKVDGESGWFPADFVMEISNEHVQRRNLRQRYHVMKAADHVLSRRTCTERQTTSCLQ